MIDVNVHLSRWPFRRLPCDETPRLVEKLQSCGITQAWAGSFDGLLHRDIEGVNARLAEECKRHGAGLLIPFGSVNPTLPDWEEDLRRCDEVHGMPGVRLHPNYHGYTLDDPLFTELLTLAERRRLIVQLAMRMEDTRTQHPLMPVPDVDLAPLTDFVAARPNLRLVILNGLHGLRANALAALIKSGNVYFEVATLEGVGGIANLLQTIPPDRLLFGSHFPFFVIESALLKLRESELTPAQLEAISHQNAERLLSA
ncbi:MAG: amidohydrolase family protein [Thermoguttaceae bacterium]